MRRTDLIRPFHGVRAQAVGRRTPRSLIHIYSQRMPQDAFSSHVSAALIHGLPLPPSLQNASAVHVATENAGTRRSGDGVVGHHARRGSLRVIVCRTYRVTTAVDTWCQLAATLSIDNLIIVGDALVRRHLPLATLAELYTGVARFAGQRGVKKLRVALKWIRPRTDSPKETELRLMIVRAGLPEPKVNFEIKNQYGAIIATGDLVYARCKVLVEYDGGQLREDEEQYHWDIDRLDTIMEEGWRVIRINKSHLRNPLQVAYKIETALRAAGWHT